MDSFHKNAYFSPEFDPRVKGKNQTLFMPCLFIKQNKSVGRIIETVSIVQKSVYKQY